MILQFHIKNLRDLFDSTNERIQRVPKKIRGMIIGLYLMYMPMTL